MDATALDILVLLLVGGAGVLGGLRGFSTEALSLGAWVLAVVALKVAHGPVATLLTGPTGSGPAAAILAFLVVFGLTFLAARFAARSIGQRVRQSALGPFDRLLGLGFGALKGLLIATLIFLLAALVFETIGGRSGRPAWMTEARTYPLLNASGRALVDFVEARRKEADSDADAGAGNRMKAR